MKAIRAVVVALAVALAGGTAWAQDGELPPGHPAVDDDDAPADPHAGNPHGANPHGDADDEDAPNDDDPHGGPHGKNPHGGGDPRVFKPPPEGTQDDPSLKPGVLVIAIHDAKDQPIARAPVVIEVLHSTVAKGDSQERLAKTTNDAGELLLDSLPFGSGTTYRISTTRSGGSYALPPFALGDQAGKRALLHAYEASSNLDELLIGSKSIAFITMKQEAIQIEEVMEIYNLSPVAWLADVTMSLPAEFKAWNREETGAEVHVEEVSGKGVALRGTLSPGVHDVAFTYQLPLTGSERQALSINLLPRNLEGRVMLEAGKSMTLDVTGFPPAQRGTMSGKHVLVTERGAPPDQGGVRTLDITIGGLPTPGPGRWIAVILAAIAVAAGLWTTFASPIDAADPEARRDLEEAREALLAELISLERMHKTGEVGPKTYARVRASLLDALARVVDQLARSDRGRSKKRKAAEAASARGAA